MIHIIVCGAAGRMGTRLSNWILDSDDLKLVGATERPGHRVIGKDIGSVIGREALRIPVVDDLASVIQSADVVLDFTTPSSTLNHARIAGEAGTAMVVGTTGFSPEELIQFKAFVAGIPCVMAPNYSMGVNLLFKLVEEAARILGDSYDVEIVEMHHHFKKDAPSGTAKRLGEAAARGLQRNLAEVAVYGREGMVGERTKEEIGIHAVRAGDLAGDHMVLFASTGERVELIHRASSRDPFVMGALRAVRFVVNAQPGQYDMGDVLGIK